MERVVPLVEAEKRMRVALAEFGMRAELADLCPDAEPTAWACRMRTDGGRPAAQGMGKGLRDEARVGAVFEALEHYLTGPDRFDPSAVRLVEAAELAAGLLRREACSLLLGRLPGRLACHRYRPLAGGQEILAPLFLSAPWYPDVDGERHRERAGDVCDYGDLMRYSCNSGSAIGVTATEALLHGVNEAIERDALSLFLVRAFLGADGFRPTVIDPATLPGKLANAYAVAERFTGSPVFLLDITSDLGVPSMLAYTAPAAGRPHRRGAGTSLSPTHAAWRALTELIQTTAGAALSEPGRTARQELAGLAEYPALYACGRFDLTDHLRGARVVPFPPCRRLPGPAAQLRRVIAVLVANGYPPYARTVAGLRAEITAVHVLVPGLERFMLITSGNLVVPGPRGEAAARGERPRSTR